MPTHFKVIFDFFKKNLGELNFEIIFLRSIKHLKDINKLSISKVPIFTSMRLKLGFLWDALSDPYQFDESFLVKFIFELKKKGMRK